MPRILYICPHHNIPSGGVRTLYHHVNHLSKSGFDASIVHFESEFKMEWFETDVPVITGSKDMDVDSDDWLVFPEGPIAAMEEMANLHCHKAVLCQNHFYIFDTLSIEKKWSDYGVETVLVTSKEIKNYVHKVFGIKGVYIPYAIDHQLFAPNPEARIPQIAYMPRKGAWNIKLARGILWHRKTGLRSIPWIPIENVPEKEVAERLKQSAFFISTSYREGFGLPPLEAMACGCIVIGFAGGGGKEYANKNNGFWVDDEDPMGLAETLEKVLSDYLADPEDPIWEKMRRSAIETAKAYHFRRQKDRLINFWQRNLE